RRSLRSVSRRFFFLFLLLRPPPRSPLFPYTTLFRSSRPPVLPHERRLRGDVADRRTAVRPRELPGGGTGVRAVAGGAARPRAARSEEHTSELQSRENLVCRLLLEKKKNKRA